MLLQDKAIYLFNQFEFHYKHYIFNTLSECSNMLKKDSEMDLSVQASLPWAIFLVRITD